MKKVPRWLTYIACILIANEASSQIINIDKIDTLPYYKKAKWNGNIAAGLEIDKQKSTLYDASNFLDVSLQKQKELLILSASNRFTYNGPQDFLNTGYLHSRWRHHYKNQLHIENYTQFGWDSKIGLRNRFLLGENVRYNFWHKRSWEMTFATGVMYERETWDYDAVDSNKLPSNTADIVNNRLKSNNYIKWDGNISSISRLTFAIFYQARFNNFLNQG